MGTLLCYVVMAFAGLSLIGCNIVGEDNNRSRGGRNNNRNSNRRRRSDYY